MYGPCLSSNESKNKKMETHTYGPDSLCENMVTTGKATHADEHN